MNTEEFKKYLAGEAQDEGVSSPRKWVEEIAENLKAESPSNYRDHEVFVNEKGLTVGPGDIVRIHKDIRHPKRGKVGMVVGVSGPVAAIKFKDGYVAGGYIDSFVANVLNDDATLDEGVSSEGDKSVEELQSDLAKHKKRCVAKPGNCPKEKELRAAIEEKEAPKDNADKKVSEAEGNGVEDDDFESILGTQFKMAAEECTDTLAKSQLRCGKDLIRMFQKNDDGSIDIEIAVENPAPEGIDYELGNGRGYRDVWEDEAVLDDYKREFSDIVDDLLEERGYHGDELYDFGDWDVDPGDEETLIYSVHAEPDKDDDDDAAEDAGVSSVKRTSKARKYLDAVAEDWSRVHADESPCKAKTPESCPFNQKAEKGDSDVSSDKGDDDEEKEKLPETKEEFNAYFLEKHPDLVKDLYDTGHMDSVSEAVAEKYAREVYKDPWGHFGDDSYDDFLESSAKWLCQEQREADE